MASRHPADGGWILREFPSEFLLPAEVGQQNTVGAGLPRPHKRVVIFLQMKVTEIMYREG